MANSVEIDRSEPASEGGQAHHPAPGETKAVIGRYLNKVRSYAPRYALLVFLVVMYAGFWVAYPAEFGSLTNVRIIVESQAVTLLLGLAVLFPLRAGDFDLSIAGSMGLSAAVAGVLMEKGVGIPMAILLSLLSVAAVGVMNASLIVWAGLPPFVVTLAALMGLEGVAAWITKGQLVPSLPGGFVNLFNNDIWVFPIAVCIGWVLGLVIWYVFQHCRFGRHLLFIGWNRSAAERSGVPVARNRFIAFVACAIIAGIAGLCFAGTTGSVDESAVPAYLISPFAAAFLGTAAISIGRFNAFGTIVAIYVLAVAVSGFELLGAAYWIAEVFDAVALIAAIALARVFHGGAMNTGITP